MNVGTLVTHTFCTLKLSPFNIRVGFTKMSRGRNLLSSYWARKSHNTVVYF